MADLSHIITIIYFVW